MKDRQYVGLQFTLPGMVKIIEVKYLKYVNGTILCVLLLFYCVTALKSRVISLLSSTIESLYSMTYCSLAKLETENTIKHVTEKI